MYNEEYENEQEEKTSDNFLVNFYYNNKVLIWILIGVVAFILIMSLLTKGGSSSSSGGGYDVSIISRDENVVIAIGHTYPLKAQVKNNSNARVTWSSSDENVATVNVDSGTVTAVGYGTAKIYATYIHSDNTKYTSNPPKEVTVADGDPTTRLTDVSFQTGSLLMPLNSKYQIRLSLSPSNGYVTNKVFTSSNTGVATVDNTGLVTSVGAGESTITLDVNGGAIRKEIKVYVSSDYTRSEIIVTPSTITFDGELIKMKIGSSEKLKYSLFPIDANASRLTWSSNNEEVAKVDQNGIVKALKAGRATITLKSVTGVSDTIDIEVEENIVEVTDISLNTGSIYLTVGQSETIIPTISPSNASNKSLSYISGDSTIAAVAPNQTGTSATVYGFRAGTTTITVISNNNIEKRISVTVANSSSESSGSSSGGSSSGGGSSSSNQGFTISSQDANWATNHEGFIVTSYNSTVNNTATPPVKIIVTKTSSSIAKLRVAVCNYPDSSCNPSSSSTVYEIVDSGSFTIYQPGTYILKVGKYNSSGTLTGTVDKYIGVGDSSGNTGGNSSICPKCNGNVTCFTAPSGATSATQCTGTVPAGKQISCTSSGCTVTECTGNTYSTATRVTYSSSLRTTCTACPSGQTANSDHSGCGSGGSGSITCPKCNGTVTCFTAPAGATSTSQCTGTVPAGKQISCTSSGCTVTDCTGNTYSTATRVTYSSSLRTSCAACPSGQTANSSHTGCTGGSRRVICSLTRNGVTAYDCYGHTYSTYSDLVDIASRSSGSEFKGCVRSGSSYSLYTCTLY